MRTRGRSAWKRHIRYLKRSSSRILTLISCQTCFCGSGEACKQESWQAAYWRYKPNENHAPSERCSRRKFKTSMNMKWTCRHDDSIKHISFVMASPRFMQVLMLPAIAALESEESHTSSTVPLPKTICTKKKFTIKKIKYHPRNADFRPRKCAEKQNFLISNWFADPRRKWRLSLMTQWD